MHSLPDGEYHYILNYQDHLTKFCHLRPLKGKDAAGVARELYQIFASFGAPLILQSDNGLEFRNQVVSSLKLLWPGRFIISGLIKILNHMVFIKSLFQRDIFEKTFFVNNILSIYNSDKYLYVRVIS
jgi:hypothetical protein